MAGEDTVSVRILALSGENMTPDGLRVSIFATVSDINKILQDLGYWWDRISYVSVNEDMKPKTNVAVISSSWWSRNAHDEFWLYHPGKQVCIQAIFHCEDNLEVLPIAIYDDRSPQPLWVMTKPKAMTDVLTRAVRKHWWVDPEHVCFYDLTNCRVLESSAMEYLNEETVRHGGCLPVTQRFKITTRYHWTHTAWNTLEYKRRRLGDELTEDVACRQHQVLEPRMPR